MGKAVGEDLGDSLEMEAGKKRPQNVVCYVAGDETGELELWNRRECEGCLQDSLFGMPI